MGITPQTLHRMHIYRKPNSHCIQHQRQTRPILKSSERQKGNSHLLHNHQHEHKTVQWTPAKKNSTKLLFVIVLSTYVYPEYWKFLSRPCKTHELLLVGQFHYPPWAVCDYKQYILLLSQALYMTNIGIIINYSIRGNKQVIVRMIHVYITVSIEYELIEYKLN